MALPKLESFTNTNGTTLPAHNANWVHARAATFNESTIQSNHLACNTAGTSAGQIYAWTGDTFNNDQYAQSVVIGLVSGGGPCARLAAGVDHGYIVDSFNGDRELLATPGVWTALFTDAGVLSINDVQRIEVSGSSVTYKINGATLATVTNATWASGSAGLLADGADGTQMMDSWEGGNLTGAQTVTPNAIATAEAVFAPAVTLQVLPVGVGTAASLPQPIVLQQMLPGTITTLAQVYQPTLTIPQIVTPNGISTAEAVHAPTASIPSPQTVTPNAIASAEQVYQPVISLAGGPQTTIPGAIPSGEQVYAPALTQQVLPDTIATAAIVRNAMVQLVTPTTVNPNAIATAESVYDPLFVGLILSSITPGTIPSVASVYSPSVRVLPRPPAPPLQPGSPTPVPPYHLVVKGTVPVLGRTTRSGAPPLRVGP